MHSLSPSSQLPISNFRLGVGFGSPLNGSPSLPGYRTDGSVHAMMESMQMLMALMSQVMSFAMMQQAGFAPPALAGFGAGSPGLGRFLGSGGEPYGRQPQARQSGSSHKSGDVPKAGQKTGRLVDLGGGKKVDASIADNVRKMIADAKKDGVDLKITSAHRSRQQQEVLYQKYLNGTGNLAAKPGTSNHESGLAIDFSNTRGAYAWLKKNAGRYGLKNLPSEPWHYSTNGR